MPRRPARSSGSVKIMRLCIGELPVRDSLQVGRHISEASTTFNYIITSTAPRYTIRQIMLFNVTGLEGKSYANNVLNYQFRLCSGQLAVVTRDMSTGKVDTVKFTPCTTAASYGTPTRWGCERRLGR
ncbi:hypothetical protein DPEC_G00067940 [Dallia pectoralis]|uniref:Uncharacterized protein n=1 Tax=Dallia pectoralis TaxID=75939 RepID=A0ACC2H1J2_DALPE|nr:hypothetical protein DPEC_G00067940 [Dallia pectoralis]